MTDIILRDCPDPVHAATYIELYWEKIFSGKHDSAYQGLLLSMRCPESGDLLFHYNIHVTKAEAIVCRYIEV